jgi:hypothetical protein
LKTVYNPAVSFVPVPSFLSTNADVWYTMSNLYVYSYRRVRGVLF